MSLVQTLVIEVVEVRGACPMYKVGDRFWIEEGYKLSANHTICMHLLQSISPYYIPLSRGIHPEELGLSGPKEGAYLQCLDPIRFTGGSTVTFRVIPLGRHSAQGS
jgi:uncharacterized repeat protein (TIGR04076 family)